METNNSYIQNNEEEFSIKEFIQFCLAKWRWFAISMLITLSFGVYKILTTHPSYTRYTDILIKTNDSGDMGGQMEKFASIGTFRGNTTVFNEIYAVQSPANIMETVKRLNLDMNYYSKGFFHDHLLYGSSLPIKATLIDNPEDSYASFTMHLCTNGSYTLTDFSGTDYTTGEPIENTHEIEGRLSITSTGENETNDTIMTPIGRIHISPMPHYITPEEDMTIYISHSDLYNTTNHYINAMSFQLKDKDADIITIAINDQSIERADDILETLIEVYNKRWIEDKNKIADSTSEFIDERLKYISEELNIVDSDISTYKSKNLLPDVDVATSMYMSQNREINNKILDLNNELEMARSISEYLTNEDTKHKILPTNVGISDASINVQITNYNRDMLQRNSLAASSSTRNPLVIDLDNSLAAMRSAIIESISNQISALQTQINNLEREERQINERIAKNPTQSKYLVSAGREQTVKETLYLFLLQKREENQLSKAFTAYNTRIITPATGSIYPTAPRSKRMLLICLVMGIIIPAGYIIIRDYFNTKLRGRKDLEDLGIPIVGEIPFMNHKKRKLKKKEDTIKLVIKEGNRNIINEAFRVLRTNIEFMNVAKEKNVIICTSFNPGSGKSFTIINLAASLALKKKHILMIDGDMRHASLSKYTNSPTTGLSNYLAGLCGNNINEIIIKNSEYIDLIPVGTIPPNPTELLESKRFQELIQEVRGKYDYIFIDCPPIDIVADTSIIEKQSDRTLFVVRSGLLERRMIPELGHIYKENRLKNMTLIINGVEEKHGRYGYNYGYGYGYRYHQRT